MELLLLIIAAIIGWHFYKPKESRREIKQTSYNKSEARLSGNCLYVYNADGIKVLGRFRQGIVSYGENNNGAFGYYDKEGKVYNTEHCLIGNVDNEGKLYISREYHYDRLKKILPDARISDKNVEKWRALGEVMGVDKGIIIEGYNYDDTKAYYETDGFDDIVTPVVGAGATYIVMVYEQIIDSEARDFYKFDVTKWLEK